MELELIGNLYAVEALSEDGGVWTVGNFVAWDVEEAIKKAKSWFVTESPDTIIGNVVLVKSDVIK